MQRKQPLCAAQRAAGRAADKLLDGPVKRERARLHLIAQRLPRREAVLARHHRLRVVQRECGLAQLGV